MLKIYNDSNEFEVKNILWYINTSQKNVKQNIFKSKIYCQV